MISGIFVSLLAIYAMISEDSEHPRDVIMLVGGSLPALLLLMAADWTIGVVGSSDIWRQ